MDILGIGNTVQEIREAGEWTVAGWLRRVVAGAISTGVIGLGTLGGGGHIGAASPPSADMPPRIGARAAILMDLQTGAILYEKNAFAQLDPASLTKIMTAILTIEHGHLHREVTISPRAAHTIGSRMHLAAGQRYTVLDLLKGLLLRSGNDAAVALAEANAGSVKAFVAQMDMKAQEVGAFNTTFENPNGLTAPGHYSSAYDLAVIARAALALPLFREIVASRQAKVTELTHRHTRTIYNTNRLLGEFSGADGVKTGTTNAAGKCLVASATRHGRRLLAVVLDSPDRWGEAARLLQWGFDVWTTQEVVRPGQPLADIAVTHGVRDRVTLVAQSAVWVSLPVNTDPRLFMRYPRSLTAPVRRRPVGWVTVVGPNQAPQRVWLVPHRRVDRKPVPHRFWDWMTRWLTYLNFQDGAGAIYLP